MRAWNLTRKDAHYRHEAFSAGLRAAGFEVAIGPPVGKLGDLLLVWNRYAHYNEIATAFESRGGTVAVVENGYLQGPKEGGDQYALALHAHNGRGVVPEGGPERWDALGVAVEPWRATGGHVLVCPNRPFGQPGSAMPADWPEDVCRRLATLTEREIRLRPHPGNAAPAKPLAEDLEDCWAAVIWSSSAGVHALVAGIPVFRECPWWICAGATSHNPIELPLMMMGDAASRLAALHRLAWSQWRLGEIESGEAFRSLLRSAREGKVASAA